MACDDSKHSVTISARSAGAPNQLVSWDRLVQPFQLLSRGGGDWSLFKADREAAYKLLPIYPADQRFAIAALRRPNSHLWYGFATRTLLLGTVYAVLHYNVLPRILAALTNRCLGVPLVEYFDDFASLIRRVLGGRDLSTFMRFAPFLGFA